MAIVLVTGASSGFGEAIALAFASAGHTTVATMRDPDAAPASLRSGEWDRLSLAVLDVSDEGARRRVVKEVLARHGRLDVLVNNAGIAPMSALEDTSEAMLRAVFETNYFGACDLMRRVLPIMRAQGGGRIVNVSAIGAVMNTPLLGAYCASKHALDASTAALDIEANRPFGVRAVSVLPGRYQTAIFRKSPAIEISPPYRPIAAALERVRAALGPPAADLSPVVRAVLEAATALKPPARILVPDALADRIASAVAEMEALHDLEVARAGLA